VSGGVLKGPPLSGSYVVEGDTLPVATSRQKFDRIKHVLDTFVIRAGHASLPRLVSPFRFQMDRMPPAPASQARPLNHGDSIGGPRHDGRDPPGNTVVSAERHTPPHIHQFSMYNPS
jgi:hypothetical protein